MERVGDGDEVRRLLGALGIDRAAKRGGWFAIDRDGCPPRRAIAQITGRPNPGCTSSVDPASKTTSMTLRMS